MNGKTYAYLEVAAEPSVGALLLDPRPAFVFRADGSGVTWANAAGAAFFGEKSMGALLHRRLSTANPIARQAARLAKLLPSEGFRMEMLAFGFGVRLEKAAAACRRLNLADGESALLAVVASDGPRESLGARAERLADTIADHDCLVAVLAADGRVLGASGGFADLAPASETIDAMVEEADTGRGRLVKQTITVAGIGRPAGVARIDGAGERLFLLIVGPADAASRAEPAASRPMPAAAPSPALIPAPLPPRLAPPVLEVAPQEAESVPAPVSVSHEPEPVVEAEADGLPVAEAVPEEAEEEAATPEAAPAVDGPAPRAETAAEMVPTHEAGETASEAPPAPAVELPVAESPVEAAVPPEEPKPAPAEPPLRFLWQTDADLEFVFLSPALGLIVGPGNASLVGKTWRQAIDRLHLDPDGALTGALAGLTSWSGVTVHWPVEGRGERIAVELSAVPSFARDGRFEGYRGIGLCHLGERVPDEHPPQAEAPSEPAAAPLTFSEDDVDDAARSTVEGGQTRFQPPAGPKLEPEAPALPSAPVPPAAPPAPERSNIVRLPGASGPRAVPAERLSGHEQDAFRRIAEALGVQMARVSAPPPSQAPAAAPAAPSAESKPAEPKPAPPAPPEAEAAAPQPAKPAAPAQEKAPDLDPRLLDRVPVGIIIFREGKTLFANRPFLDLLGYESLADFGTSGGPEAIFPGGSTNWNKPQGGAGEVTAQRKDGSTLPVEARLHAVTWAGATALMFLIREAPAAAPAAAHPSEPAAATVAAEKRVEELEAILDTATDGVIVIDGRGRIGNVNRSAEALFGIDANEVLGQPFTELLAEESRKAALDYLDGLASNGVASVLNDGREVIGKVPQGGLIPLFMTMGRIADTGKFCAVLRDITHWKNVEEELVAARRAAETANAQKSDFLAKVSHEIRTPLNAIIGFSEVMIEERFGAIGNARYQDYLRDIHRSGAHLLSLINDLLDLSKIEAGKLELHFESVPVNESIQETVALMQPQANRERIIIRTSLSSDLPNVVADPRSLRQILLNLLSNAVKFTKAGGQVIVSTALEENGEVVLRIRDTGIGMSDKDMETAMKPFRQVATSGRAGGTGLGLPLTKALVEANRASFAIDSAPNQGTLVKITFPTSRVLAG